MTKRIRGAVRSTGTRSFGWAWVAAVETETGTTENIRYGYAPTMPEALAECHAAQQTLHRALMDEVHASRARRRQLVGIATPPVRCTCPNLTETAGLWPCPAHASPADLIATKEPTA